MIEIVMRDDINDYEPKAFYGKSRREVATIAMCVVVGLVIGLPSVLVLHLDIRVVGWLLIVIGSLIAVIGFKQFSGLPAEKYIAYQFREFSIPTHLGIETDVWIVGLEKSRKETDRGTVKRNKKTRAEEREW